MVLIKKAIEYCEMHNYEKASLLIQFPMSSRHLEDNVSKYDYQFLLPYLDSFDSLLSLFKVAKAMQIDSLYQLCAAAIACFFRQRCMEDIRKELCISNSPMDA